MILLVRPDGDFIDATIDSQRRAGLTYSQVGWTMRSQCPDGFATNQWNAVIGKGELVFERAKAALQNYQLLQLGWIQHVGPSDPIAANSIVCTLGRQFMVYSLNFAKIVYVDDRISTQFSFGYGTTCEHPLIGEERFTVSIDASTGDVTYSIFSFSRPNAFVFQLALPWLRRAQRRFCRDSTEAMHAACRHEHATR